ncbi:uncharacterized protein J8A68_002055 [[Candida] subhashii]|uniref:Uncharacterized protein n=1 Tax=[Candida] subhashii TaxID=561895 RepID=A0A8J5QSF8_9ASCO|nr:uncharacterized protein J8A68_002055 [[Candida] subhashii]KAG7664417.1 hypothetical protein J8A68_002055 [[Candida] subhashii]
MRATISNVAGSDTGVRRKTECTLSDDFENSIEVSNSTQSMSSQKSVYTIEATTIGTFHFDDHFPVRVIQKYAEHIYNQDMRYGDKDVKILAVLLVYSSCVKAAQQLWSSYWTVPTETDAFSNVGGLPTYLPEVIDEVLLKLGDIETKYGRIRVRWPLTTFKTVLVNASYYGLMATQSGFARDIGFSFRNLIWNDNEGHEKMDHFIEKYWQLKFNKVYTHGKERFLPLRLHKRLTEEDIVAGAGPQWFQHEYPEYEVLLKLYSRRMPCDDSRAGVAFEKLGLRRVADSDEEIMTGLDAASTLLSNIRYVYHRYFWMTDLNPTGNGSPGQLFVAGKNDSTASTALITSKSMTDDEIEYGFTWVPSISFDIKSDIRMASRETRTQLTAEEFRQSLLDSR